MNIYLITILILLAMFPPFATDMYLPAFKNIELTFNTDFHSVQLSLTLFLIGYAISQLIFGPLSDRYGRKMVLLWGILLFIIFSLLCMVAQNIHWFYSARFFQSIGAGSGAVITFAIIKDLFQHEQRIRYLGIISAMMGLAPIIAPILGGHITVIFGWRAIFLFLALVGIVAFIGILKIPETNLQKSRINIKLLLQNYIDFFKNHHFILSSFSCAFAFAAMFAFIASSPKIYMQLFGISIGNFGYYFAINALAFMSGNFISVKFSRQFSSHRLNQIGALIIVFGGLLLLITHVLFGTLPYIVISMLIATLGVGMVIPAAIANAMQYVNKYTGQASSIIAFLQFGMAAFISLVVGLLQFKTPLPLGFLVCSSGLIALVCCII